MRGDKPARDGERKRMGVNTQHNMSAVGPLFCSALFLMANTLSERRSDSVCPR